MCTKWFSDGAVHKYFNPYDSPYDAYINYMNVISDFRLRLERITAGSILPSAPVPLKKVKAVKVAKNEPLVKAGVKVGVKIKKESQQKPAVKKGAVKTRRPGKK
jgi:alpha-amylase